VVVSQFQKTSRIFSRVLVAHNGGFDLFENGSLFLKQPPIPQNRLHGIAVLLNRVRICILIEASSND